MTIRSDLTCSECGGEYHLYGLANQFYGTSYKHWCGRLGREVFASTDHKDLPEETREAMATDGERWRGVSAANAARYRAERS